jgi:Base plate wedge protein 53
MDTFFKNYPLVQYGNTVANTVSVNIMSKIAFQKKLQQNFEAFHPYTIQEGDRADTIAYLYYGDSGYDWIVYYSNNIVDPYYDWYMSSTTFNNFMDKKYGSITNAKRKIKFYRSNYVFDDSMISPAAYNALSSNQKRFWRGVNSTDNMIIRYERKKEDIQFNTNAVKQLSITLVGNTQFKLNEYVIQKSGLLTIGSAEVTFANSTVCIINDIAGSITTANNLEGVESGANATVSTVNTISTSIASDIQSYFEPVSFYDYESDLNEQKKNIKLIDSAYVGAIEQEFKDLMSS